MTPENAKEIENRERLEAEDRLWAEEFTKAEVAAQILKDAKAAEAEVWHRKIIAWRVANNNWSTIPSVPVIRALIDLQERYPNVYPGRQPEKKA